MSLLLAIALLAVGWYLVESGFEFFGVLLFIGAVLALFMKPGQTPAKAQAPAAPQGYYPQPPPVIIRSGRAPQLQKIKLRIKEPWSGTTNYEDFFTNLSDVLLLPVKVLWRLLRPGRRK